MHQSIESLGGGGGGTWPGNTVLLLNTALNSCPVYRDYCDYIVAVRQGGA